jgi:hypothetical protein
MELLQLVDVHVEEVCRPLREEVATLKLLLMRVGDPLEPTEACTSTGVRPESSFPIDSFEQKLPMVEEEHLYGCISPRVGAGSMIMASVHHIMPELQELCGGPAVSLSNEQAKMDSFEFSAMASLPSLVTDFEESGDIDSAVSLSLEPVGHVVAMTPLAPELGSVEALAVAPMPSPPQNPTSEVSGEVLEHSSEALFGSELCGLLASLEAASPGYGKDIACVLAGKASEDMIKMVEKSLKKVSIWGRRRKKGVARKFSAAA